MISTGRFFYAQGWEFREAQMANFKLSLQLRNLLTILFLLVGLRMLPACSLQIYDETKEFFDPNGNPSCLFSSPEMDPTHEVYEDHIAVWQIPNEPKAVLFLAHGANKSAFAFFDPGPRCPLCYGRSQERIVVLDALARGYAVLAIQFEGSELEWDAWPRETSRDISAATEFIRMWTKGHSLEGLPLFAWGTSIGGDFVSSLSLNVKVTAQVLMCSHGRLDAAQNLTNSQYPSTLFVHTAKDREIFPKISQFRKILREVGVDTGELISYSKPVHPHFFAERIRCMSENMSEKIYSAYKAEGWIDSGDYLLKNAREVDYRSLLRKWNALPFCKEDGDLCLLDGVRAELIFAYGLHYLTSEKKTKFFHGLIPGSLQQTAELYI